MNLRGRLGLFPTSWSTAIFMVSHVSGSSGAESFFTSLTEPTMLQKGTGAYALYQWCIRQLGTPRHQRVNSTRYQTAIIIKAYNLQATGEPVQLLLWKPSQREPFPVPVNLGEEE